MHVDVRGSEMSATESAGDAISQLKIIILEVATTRM